MASHPLSAALRHSPHTGALCAAEVHIIWLNKAWRPAAPPIAKRGPCARTICGCALWRLWWHVCHTVCRKVYTERRARGCAHPPRAQRQGHAHDSLPLLAARLVQRGQPQLGCRLRLVARLNARLLHLARGQRPISRAKTPIYKDKRLPPAELHHPMTHAATCRAYAAVSLTISRTHLLQNQTQAVQPIAAHAQKAPRLLDQLRALKRQRRGDALLGRCLRHARVGMRLVHLGRDTRSAQ